MDGSAFGNAWDIMLAYTSSMAVKAVIQLGVLDIIDQAGPGQTLTIREIADQLPTKDPNLVFLSRILRFLESSKFFTSSCTISQTGEPVYSYGLTDTAKYFLKSNPESLSGFLLHLLDEVFVDPFHHLHTSVLQAGTTPFIISHGKDEWSFLSERPSLRQEFNLGQASATKRQLSRILNFYDGFKDVRTLVDVGGATGHALSAIIEVYPHINAINFDLPDVVERVPKLPGIKYVGGNMFESVPSGDAIHFKTVLHDWDDEHCIKALKNCYKATPGGGRVIISDFVVAERGTACSDNIRDGDDIGHVEQRKLAHDMVMLAHRGIGLERTKREWTRLLSAAGFPRVHVHGPQYLVSVIEAFKA